MPDIEMPNGDIVNFPDEMPKEQIKSLILQRFPDAESSLTSQEEPTLSDFTTENVLRPVARAARSVTAGTVGAMGDLAQQAVALPQYLGNIAARGIEKKVYGDNLIKPFDTSGVNTASEYVRGVFDRATGGLTKPRNEKEELGDIIAEMQTGLISPALALGKLATQGTKALGKKTLQKLTGITQESRDLAKAYQEVGIKPTLANISQGKMTRTFQNLLGNFPGSSSQIQGATQQQIDDIAKRLATTTGSTGGTIQETGQILKKGATDFIENSQRRSENLYSKVDDLFPSDTPVDLKNTFDTLNDRAVQITSEVSGGKTKGYTNFLNKIKEGAQEGKQIPYASLKALRSEVGRTLGNRSLENEERAAISKLYGALTKDMKDNIKNIDSSRIGKESALKAWNRANASHRTRTQFIEKNIQPILKKDIPEKIYQAALAGTKQGGSNVRGIIRTLNPIQKDFVRGTVVKRMGLASAGNQDDFGEVFNASKFLTEWNKLSPEAKSNIFTKPQLDSITKLNKVISNIKETGKVRQTSNNLPYLQWLGIGALGATNLPAAAAAVGGANITARMMTNPDFVKWLAKAPTVKIGEIPKHLKALSAIAVANPTVQSDILNYIESITLEEENDSNRN